MSSSGIGTFVAPYTAITSVDRSGQLLVVNAVALAISLFSVASRIYISGRSSQNVFRFYKDDLMCFAALLFSIIQFVLIWVGTSLGNGKSIRLISPPHLVRIQKTQYAVDIVYLATLFCSRASISFLLERLQGFGFTSLWRFSFAGLSLWFLTSVFAVALKCDLNHPWIQYGVQCTGLLSRWQAIEILGIIAECALFALVIRLVYVGRMTWPSRVKITLLFATRAIVIVFSALRIAYLPEYLHSPDPTYFGIPTSIYAIAEAHASIITATTPLLKSFILRFLYVGASDPILSRPVFAFSVHRRDSLDEPPVSGTRSNFTEPEKTTASSSSGEDTRPKTSDCPSSV